MCPCRVWGVHGGDHPVRGDPAGDREDPVLTDVQVLAQHGRQQRAGLGRGRVQLATIQHRQHRCAVLGEGVDEQFAGGAVVVVTDRLTRGGVVVVAADHRPQLGFLVGASSLEYPADARPDQRDGVHGGGR